MNPEFWILQLTNSAQAIQSLSSGIAIEQARWKPAPDAWSILEVVNHLYDEEREDFRAHLQGVMQIPQAAWTKINPPGWVIERRYLARDPAVSLQNFIGERASSLTWLRELQAPNWDASYDMPWGRLSAGDLLASWAAHDLLHLRQLVELRYACQAQSALPFKVAYAGDW